MTSPTTLDKNRSCGVFAPYQQDLTTDRVETTALWLYNIVQSLVSLLHRAISA